MSMKQAEDRFNKEFNYPWVFLSEEPFDANFIKYAAIWYRDNAVNWLWLFRRTTELTNAEVHYGQIPRDHWYQPDFIDEEKAKASREQMVKDNVIYGGSVP